jgi:hypothetical protein
MSDNVIWEKRCEQGSRRYCFTPFVSRSRTAFLAPWSNAFRQPGGAHRDDSLLRELRRLPFVRRRRSRRGSPYSIQRTRNGTFLIGDTGLVWHDLPKLHAKGDLRVGARSQTGTFRRFNHTAQNRAHSVYAVFDQTLWRPASAGEHGPGLGMFLEYGETDPDASLIYQRFG